jgi:predicted nucleotidyltransferase
MSLEKLRSDQVDLNYIKNILENLIQVVAALDPDASVILFGSMITNNVNNESDIDLAIIISNDLNETEFRKNLSGKKVLGKWPTDLLIYTKAQFDSNVENIGGICLEIKDNGVELYPHWKWIK